MQEQLAGDIGTLQDKQQALERELETKQEALASLDEEKNVVDNQLRTAKNSAARLPSLNICQKALASALSDSASAEDFRGMDRRGLMELTGGDAVAADILESLQGLDDAGVLTEEKQLVVDIENAMYLSEPLEELQAQSDALATRIEDDAANIKVTENELEEVNRELEAYEVCAHVGAVAKAL